MYKQAYLILAHENWKNVENLIASLDYELHDVFIHIDKKVNNIPYELLKRAASKSNIYFTKRISVHWGGYSQVRATMILIEHALEVNNYEYLHILSGVDMPLKKQSELYYFFHGNYPKEFVRFESFEKNTNVNKFNFKNFPIDSCYLKRVKFYHLMDFELIRNNRKLTRIINKSFTSIERMLGVNRIKGESYIFQKGDNWASITNQFAIYLLNNKTKIRQIFKYGDCVDEMFLQTFLINSDYVLNLYSFDHTSNKRYIDFERGSPYVFKIKDFEELKAASQTYLFARKIDLLLSNFLVNGNNLGDSNYDS